MNSDAGADPNETHNGVPVLVNAIKWVNYDLSHLLISYGADVNSVEQGMSPLAQATAFLHVGLITRMMERGASLKPFKVARDYLKTLARISSPEEKKEYHALLSVDAEAETVELCNEAFTPDISGVPLITLRDRQSSVYTWLNQASLQTKVAYCSKLF